MTSPRNCHRTVTLLLVVFSLSTSVAVANEIKQILYGKTYLVNKTGVKKTSFGLNEGGAIVFEDKTSIDFLVAPSYKKVFSMEMMTTALKKLGPFMDCRFVHIDPAKPYNIQNRRYQTFLFIASCQGVGLSGLFVNYVPAVKNRAVIFYSQHTTETKQLTSYVQRLRLHKKAE